MILPKWWRLFRGRGDNSSPEFRSWFCQLPTSYLLVFDPLISCSRIHIGNFKLLGAKFSGYRKGPLYEDFRSLAGRALFTISPWRSHLTMIMSVWFIRSTGEESAVSNNFYGVTVTPVEVGKRWPQRITLGQDFPIAWMFIWMYPVDLRQPRNNSRCGWGSWIVGISA